MHMDIRNAVAADVAGLEAVVASSELFPPAYLAEMMADYLTNPQTAEAWFAAVANGQLVGVAYCAPEKFTEGTYNLYAIGVLKAQQGQGVGRGLMAHVEQWLQAQGQRLLLVETSGDAQFALTRQFYLKLGYHHEATIRDFWQAGEDKWVFWKKLSY